MTLEHLRLASSDRESLDESEPEDDGLCHLCGHALDYHRTASRDCTHEVYDDELDAWMRCGCKLPLRIVE